MKKAINFFLKKEGAKTDKNKTNLFSLFSFLVYY